SGITQAWQFDGTGGGTMESLQDISGNPADADASFELWIRPTDLIDSDLVFETGGSGDGISVIITDADSDTVYDDLQFIVKDSGSMATLTVDLSAELGDVSSEFFQVVGVYDRDYSGTTDRVLVYLNATFIAENQAYTVLNDWAGGDGTGLGRVNGSANIGNTTNFEGDIA
ncbi:MAG: hypothetical protein GY821_00915, partial [Gammaproteobacteria bacterium]|nr:hypothetical protein [Gammaproteobacteria bacterium]